MVSGEFFDTLGVVPAAGRLIARADDRRGCPPVAVLSDAFWARELARSPAAVGDSLVIGRDAFAVIGIAPRRFTGVDVGTRFDVAIPLCASARLDSRNVESGGRQWLDIAGRLPPGTTVEQANARLAALSPAIMLASAGGDTAAPSTYLESRIVAAAGPIGLRDFRRVFLTPLQVLMAIVALVLVIASANIAGLMAARAATRDREIAVRAALGASRGRIVRQMLTESALLCVPGAALGLVLARWGSAMLVQGLFTAGRPGYLDHSATCRRVAPRASIPSSRCGPSERNGSMGCGGARLVRMPNAECRLPPRPAPDVSCRDPIGPHAVRSRAATGA
jgi:hypothetical protein